MSVPARLLLAAAAAVVVLAGGAGSAGAATIVNATTDVPTAGGQSQTGRLVLDGVQSACASPKTPQQPPFMTTLQFRYRLHTFRSLMTEPVCITAALTTGCTGANAISSAAYIPAFVPADPAANHVADPGNQSPAATTYAFVAPAGNAFGIVVHETTSGAGCPSYTLNVSSQGPWASAVPSVQGTPSLGTVLTGADATWLEAPAVARRWRRCDRGGVNCSDIPGATGTTYTVTAEDLGRTLRFRNTATDGAGTNSADSGFAEPFIPFATRPDESLGAGDRVQQGFFVRDGVEGRCGVAATAPTILNPAQNFLYDATPVASLLNEEACLVARTTPGSCLNGVSPAIYSPAFAPGAIATNYRGNSGNAFGTPGAVSWLLPAGGSGEVTAVTTGACASYALTLGTDGPFATARPTVSGTPAVGAALTAGDGTWSGSPALSRAWLRCDASGAACTAIGGATGASYVPTAADAGSRLRVRVTATQGRSYSSDAEPTGAVAAAPPPAAGGAGTPGGAAPRDTRAPRVRLSVPRTSLQRALRRGSFALRATCDEACRLTLAARVTRAAGRRLGGRTIASARRRLRAARRTTVRVRLTRRARRALRRRSSVAFTFRVVAADAAGNRRTVTRRVRVRRARR